MVAIAKSGEKPVRAFREALANIPRRVADEELANQIYTSSPTSNSMRTALYRYSFSFQLYFSSVGELLCENFQNLIIHSHLRSMIFLR